MIAGLDWNYDERDGWIIIKSGKRTIMKIQKPKKSQGYWDAKREISDIYNALGV